MVDVGDMDAQKVLIAAGITEEQWNIANAARRRVLLRGARLVSALNGYLAWAADVAHWPGKPAFASAAQLHAGLLLDELVSFAERSLKGAKGHGRVLNRMLASEWWAEERTELKGQLKWAKRELKRRRSEALREEAIGPLVATINNILVQRFGHDALRVQAEHLRMLNLHSPTYVAQQLLLRERFKGVATHDDTAHKQLRAARAPNTPLKNKAP